MSRETHFQTVPLTEISAKGMVPDNGVAKYVVLVVDDEAIIADTLTAILGRSGFATLTAYDGHSALDLARAIPPDLLLTDVVMPGMNGIDLALAVRQAIPECKILLFSGQAASMDLLLSARDAGRDYAIIAKPIHPKELLVRISESLSSRHEIPQPGPEKSQAPCEELPLSPFAA